MVAVSRRRTIPGGGKPLPGTAAGVDVTGTDGVGEVPALLVFARMLRTRSAISALLLPNCSILQMMNKHILRLQPDSRKEILEVLTGQIIYLFKYDMNEKSSVI